MKNPDKRTVSFSTLIKEKNHLGLKELSEREDRSIAYLTNKAIENYLKATEKIGHVKKHKN